MRLVTIAAKDKVTCKRCLLHSRIPGIVIGEDGLCEACRSTGSIDGDLESVTEFFVRRMEKLFLKGVKYRTRPEPPQESMT